MSAAVTPLALTATRTGTLHAVQALRGCSALWVLLYHAQLLQGATGWLAFDKVASLGYLGVDLFFVISGFIMAMNTAPQAPGASSAWRFALLRALRVYSGWWPVMLLCLLGMAATTGWPAGKDLWGSWWLSSINIDTLLLPITWTLTFELYFYLCIALTLLLPAVWRWRAIAAMAAVVLVLNGYWFSQDRFSPQALHLSHWGMYLFSSPLCLEFLLGYACWHAQRWLRGVWPWWCAASVLSAVAVGSYALYGAHHPSGLSGFFHYPERAVLGGLFATCTLLLFLRSAAWLPRRTSIWAGDISYILYLVHLPVVWSGNAWPGLQTLAVPARLGLTVLACLLAASVLHYLVEKPLYARCRQWMQVRHAPAPAATA